jgi:hypothetical protein
MGPVKARAAERRVRGPLSYANVVSTLALVLAVGGGSALAAGSLAGQAKHHKPKPKPHLTLNSADKSFISAQIAAGHVAFATSASSAASATTATNATNATNATSATTATNANTAATATNALSLGGVAASGYTRNDCVSETGQIKGFVLVPASSSFPSTFTAVSGAYDCSGQAVQAKRLGLGDYEVQFLGSPAAIAVGSVELSGAANFAYASVGELGPGDFEVRVFNTFTSASQDGPFALVTP